MSLLLVLQEYWNLLEVIPTSGSSDNIPWYYCHCMYFKLRLLNNLLPPLERSQSLQENHTSIHDAGLSVTLRRALTIGTHQAL